MYNPAPTYNDQSLAREVKQAEERLNTAIMQAERNGLSVDIDVSETDLTEMPHAAPRKRTRIKINLNRSVLS